MNEKQCTALLAVIWSHGLWEESDLILADGRRLSVRSAGHRSEESVRTDLYEFDGAAIEIAHTGIVMHGTVRVDACSSDWKRTRVRDQKTYLLHLVSEHDSIVLCSGEEIPTLVLRPDPSRTEIFEQLLSGTGECERFWAGLEAIDRYQVLDGLAAERLNRKVQEVMEIHRTVDEDWDETAYICLMRSLGMGSKKKSYEALARSLPYRYIRHVRGDARQIEALLTGHSGYLSRVDPDPYLRQLQDIYLGLKKELALKRPVMSWRGDSVRPSSLPPVQLAAMSVLLAQTADLSQRLIQLCAADDREGLRKFFHVEVAQYWKENSLNPPSHYGRGDMTNFRIDLRIINFVIPVVTAYARMVGDGDLQEKVFALYETVAPEDNRYTRQWASFGQSAENALESQALIQLSTEYCGKRACGKCPLGIRRLIRGVF